MNRKKREQLILDSAVRVFARKGYPRTSVSEIIQEAKVARGTFYLYFKSKKDLFNSLIDRFVTDISRDTAKIYAFAGDARNLQNYRNLASDLISTITANKSLAKLILIDSHKLDGEFSGKLNVFFDQLAATISQKLNDNIKSGAFRQCNTIVAANCIIGSVKEVIASWITSDSFDLEQTIKGLIDYLLHGLDSRSVSIDASQASKLEKDISEEKPVSPRPNIDDFH